MLVRDTAASSPADIAHTGAIPSAGSWQAAAVAAYQRSTRTDPMALADALAARVLALTGQHVERSRIHVGVDDQLAGVAVDSAWFRICRGMLCLVRPCVYCGVRRFTSPPIDDLGDLGYAVAIWEPRCADCMVNDEDGNHSW